LSNKYTYSAPYTEEQLFELYITKNMSQTEIGNMFGVSQHKVFKDLKRMNINSHKAVKRNQYGANNSSWKGGRVLLHGRALDGHKINSEKDQQKGYYIIKKPDHPSSDKQGYIFEHVYIALQAAGRESLDKNTECVHHINMDKHANKPENLCIMTKQKHREIHSSLEIIIGELFDKGIVGFDSELGYFIK
jgi:hypothetical protein